MATKQSFVKNTAGRSQLALKGNVSRSKPKARPKTTAKAKPVLSKRNYRRNSASSLTAGLLAAFGGALVINLFDLGVNRLMPSNVSTLWRTGIKAAAAWAFTTQTVRKLPLMRGIAPIASQALLFAVALDLVGSIVMPKVVEALTSGNLPIIGNIFAPSAPAAATPPAATPPADGSQLGAYLLPNGQMVRVTPNYANPQNRVGYMPATYSGDKRIGAPNRAFAYA